MIRKRILQLKNKFSEFGIDGYFFGVPTVIGASGIEKIIEFSLTDKEKSALDNTLDAVKKTVEETKL